MSTLVTGKWVLPIASEPIRNGAVLIDGVRIAEVGLAEELLARYPEAKRYEFEDATVLPGLVNAHTHLAMTCLKGLIPPQPFPEWLSKVPKAFGALTEDDIVASISLGAIHSLCAGTTVVGDIAYGPESLAICADMGLGGTFFWEVFGITADMLESRLAEMEFPLEIARNFEGRFEAGISPHSPYTSGPDLIKAAHALVIAEKSEYAIHVAESPAETELLTSGKGALAPVADQFVRNFKPPGTTTVGYLNRLGVLDGAAAIHCVNVTSADAAVLAAKARGVVLCPRSNAYLHTGIAPARKLHKAGVTLALGTDSLGSNHDLDLFEEARALASIAPDISAQEIVGMITHGGAKVLGLSDRFGALSPGMQADLAIFRVDGDDPYDSLLAKAGLDAIEAVMSAGIWRVMQNKPLLAPTQIAQRSNLASKRAAAALMLS